MKEENAAFRELVEKVKDGSASEEEVALFLKEFHESLSAINQLLEEALGKVKGVNHE